tara:strand:+ start:116 stop:826 length:711 start_codon:yes stop_codon:yes gene_type:complete
MSDSYGDTGHGPTEGSQTSDSGYADAGDTGAPEIGKDGNPSPVPYERFKESRDEIRTLKEQFEDLQESHRSLQGQYEETAQWNQWAWSQMNSTSSSPQQDPDVYVDPLEQRIAEIESKQQRQQQYNDTRYQQMQVKEAEKEIAREMAEAKAMYPDMEQLDVVNALMQNPNASVARLAKRSHEKQQRKYMERLKKDGYTPKPRQLQRGVGHAPVKQDFGEDLDAAEAAARARLGGDY